MLPQKLFFRIGEVAGLVGVEPHVLRYWEREFRSIRPTKSAKGQRVYSRKDVENLLRVRDLLYRDGFTIAGAKKKLKRDDGSPLDDATETVTTASSPALAVAAAGIEDETATERSRMVSPTASLADVDVTEPPPERPHHVREKLIALRTEVEAFLAELSSPGRR